MAKYLQDHEIETGWHRIREQHPLREIQVIELFPWLRSFALSWKDCKKRHFSKPELIISG
jgi:hypothetical protein